MDHLDIQELEKMGFNCFTDSLGYNRGFKTIKRNEDGVTEKYIILHLLSHISPFFTMIQLKFKIEEEWKVETLFKGHIRNLEEIKLVLQMIGA